MIETPWWAFLFLMGLAAWWGLVFGAMFGYFVHREYG